MNVQHRAPLAAIGNLCEINPKGPRGKEVSGEEPVDFLPMADLSEQGFVKISERRTYAEVAKGYTAFRDGDVLIAKITPCFENNKIAVAEVSTPWGFGSTEFHVLRPTGSIHPRYLLHFLRQDHVRRAGEKRMTGSGGQRRVPKAFLEDLKIPLPPLEEQKRIARILDQADRLRRLRATALDRLNTLAQSIFHDMFGDPFENPKNWKTEKLGDLCDVGSSKRVFVEEFVEQGVPFYRGTEVGKLGAGEVINPDLFISCDHYDRLVQHSGRPKPGDLLLPSICHDGRIWKVDNDRPFYFKDGRVLWIKQNPNRVDSEYLRNHLRHLFLNNYHKIASGTTFSELKIVNLKNLMVLTPPLPEQRAFAAIVDEIKARYILSVQANCSVPDDHIDPRRRALFVARSLLSEVRDGGRGC